MFADEEIQCQAEEIFRGYQVEEQGKIAINRWRCTSFTDLVQEKKREVHILDATNALNLCFNTRLYSN